MLYGMRRAATFANAIRQWVLLAITLEVLHDKGNWQAYLTSAGNVVPRYLLDECHTATEGDT